MVNMAHFGKAGGPPISLKLHVNRFHVCRLYSDLKGPGWIECKPQICGYFHSRRLGLFKFLIQRYDDLEQSDTAAF